MGALQTYYLKTDGWTAMEAAAPVVLPPGNLDPTAVSALVATPSISQVILSWDAATDADGSVAGYVVMRGSTTLAQVTTTTYTDAGLTPGATYSYAVYAVDNSGAFGPSTGVTVQTLADTPADVPTAANTGPRTTLAPYSGDLTITTAGQTISGLDISGDVYVQADNVTLTDCRFRKLYPSNDTGSPVQTNLTVSYCEMNGVYAPQGADGVLLDHCRIGFQPNEFVSFSAATGRACRQVRIVNSLFDRLLGSTGGARVTAIRFAGVNGALVQNTVFDFIADDGPTLTRIDALIQFQAGGGSIAQNWQLDACIFNGGGYYTVKPSGAGGLITRCQFFSRADKGTQYVYGMIPVPTTPTPVFSEAGNTLDGVAFQLRT